MANPLLPKNLTCPKCKHGFTNPLIEDGAARCPNCKMEMFRFTPEGEETSVEWLEAFMKTQSSKSAAYLVAQFLPTSMGNTRRVIAAGMLVGFIVNHLISAYKGETPK